VRVALRAAAASIPIYLAACAVPDGGLFRAARFRDLHIYQGYAEKLLHGALPYRDVFVEYPPGAFAVFLPPAAFGSDHYNAAFKCLMALCGVATLVLVALVLAELGASIERASLPAGDYAVGEETLIERKRVLDLHGAVLKGRLWPQLGKLRAACAFPYLLLEGTDVDRGPLHPNVRSYACPQITKPWPMPAIGESKLSISTIHPVTVFDGLSAYAKPESLK